jgi:non-specific serine/threonine protein kinase
MSARGIQDLERGRRAAPHPGTARRLAEALRLTATDRATFQAAGSAHARPPGGGLIQPGRRSNLPAPLSSFVGREREIAEVARQLGETRLLTLTGAGGVGKTRLGLQVAAEVLGRYSDGAWVVELAPLGDPRLASQAVAVALGVPERPGEPIVRTLVDHLRSRRALLVLDNCEHLVQSCAELADALLRACPDLTILATSRELLRVDGEIVWSVQPLGLPDPQAPSPPEWLAQADAVRLFIARARATDPNFALTEGNVEAVDKVCRQLDGLPLAIELAAARLRHLPPEQIAARLTQRFQLLTEGSRTAPKRQQTLWAAVEWSHGLLSEPERCVFRRISVFAGGWSQEAAEGICAGHGIVVGDVLDLLGQLVDKSLAQTAVRDGEGRYRLLETIREYALVRLTASGEEPAMRAHHAAYYLALAEEQGTEERTWGPEGLACLDRLEREFDNLRAALRWALDGGNGGTAARMVEALCNVWYLRGHYTEGRRWLAEVLGLPQDQVPIRVRAALLSAAGKLATRQGDERTARALQQQALAVASGLGDQWLIAGILSSLARDAMGQGDYEKARTLHLQALAHSRAVGHRLLEGLSLNAIGWVTYLEGEDYASARARATQALAIGRELGSPHLMAEALRTLGYIALGQRHDETARALLDDGLALAQRVRIHWLISALQEGLGHLAVARSDYGEARVRFTTSLQLSNQLGDKLRISTSLEGLASLAVREAQWERALQLGGAAQAVREALGIQTTRRQFLHAHNLGLRQARQAVGEDRAERAWAGGHELSVDRAVDLALAEEKPRK